MRVAVFSELGEWSASTRYRVMQVLPRLQERLGTVDVYLPDDRPVRRPGRSGQLHYFASHGRRYVRRWRQVHQVSPRYDAVLVQRGLYALGPGGIVEPLRRFPGRLVFDLDDAAFALKPSIQAMGHAGRWLYGPHQARRLLQRADAVVVSTPALADGLPPICAPVHVLPTVPDPARYRVADHDGLAPQVVWAGTNGNLCYLDPLRPVFERLGRRGVGGLTVVCSQTWAGPARFRAWSEEDEPTLFADYAVGIMPLPDTAYTRAKAGFKLLQYMAAGLPVVASPVGVNTELVTRSGAGFLAESEAEWEEMLYRLLTDPGLRAELGQRGREFVLDYANLDDQADLLASVLRGAS